MSDLKPQLMQDAQTIVEQHRTRGGDLNELVAKYAADKGYAAKVTDALTACVNRHSFKSAMQNDKQDEPAIASPSAVKMAQAKTAAQVAPQALTFKTASAGREEMRCKSASVTTAMAPVDYGPALRARLGREKLAYEGQVSVAHTEIRMGLERMSNQAHLIKRLGLEKTSGFQALVDACPAPVRKVVAEALTKAAAQPPARIGSEIALLMPQALKDFETIKLAGENLIKVAQRAGEFQARLDKVNEALSLTKGEVTAHVG